MKIFLRILIGVALIAAIWFIKPFQYGGIWQGIIMAGLMMAAGFLWTLTNFVGLNKTIDKATEKSVDNLVRRMAEEGALNEDGTMDAGVALKHIEESFDEIFDNKVKPSYGTPCQTGVDLGLSVKWAAYNIGASSEKGYGGLYGWGDVDGTHREGEMLGDMQALQFYPSHPAPEEISGSQYDIASKHWGSSWRIPTVDEMLELIKSTTHKLETVEGVTGLRMTAANGNSIFLPASGGRVGQNVSNQNVMGGYWTSGTQGSQINASSFVFGKDEQWPDGILTQVQNCVRYIGQSVRPVQDKSMFELIEEASAGNTNSMFLIARRYEDGRGVEQNCSEAIAWYKKAADLGNADAQNELGLYYRDGVGLPQDLKKAAELFEKAACQGHIGAIRCIALAYHDGNGVPRDLKKAIEWVSKVDSGDFVIAQLQWEQELNSSNKSV